MPVKSRSSTQQAYMKLLLVVAILICTNVAVANSTSELMEHRRLGGALTSMVKLVGAKTEVSFEDEWKNAFRLQARKHLADNTNRNQLTKELARRVEWRLPPQWKYRGETLRTSFDGLMLNRMKNEKELYANPAFITWMDFAFHLQPKIPKVDSPDIVQPGKKIISPHGAGYHLDDNARSNAFISMLEVLQENMDEFKGLLKPHATTEEGANDLRNNEKLTELFQKWHNMYKEHVPKYLADPQEKILSDTSADLYSKFLPDLLNKIDSTSTIKEQIDVTLKVLRENGFSDAELVKMISAGFMDHVSTKWAEEMERKLLKQWKSEHKTLEDRFKELKLNEAKTEMELYANPAFTTWMNFAFRLLWRGRELYSLSQDARQITFRSMLPVLQKEMKDTKGFKRLLKLHVETEEGTNDLRNNKKLIKLFRKWNDVYSEQWSWHKIVKTDE